MQVNEPSSTSPVSGKNKLLKLEALRGLVALYVVLHHVLPHHYLVGGFNVMHFARFGQEGVIVFFLLSGFVIHYSFVRSSDKQFSTYFKKRFFRIYIPFIAVLLAAYLVACIEAGLFLDPQWQSLIGNLFMLQDWALVKPGVLVEPYLGNIPLWSLSYEWWFYLFYWPLMYLFTLQNNKWALLNAVVIIICISSAVAYTISPNFLSRLVMYFYIWWAGLMLAEAYMRHREGMWRYMIAPISCLCIMTLTLSYPVLQSSLNDGDVMPGKHPLLEARHFGFAALAILISLVWRYFKWAGFNPFVKFGLLFSPISYSLYISHWFLLVEAEYLKFIQNSWIETIGYIVVTLIFCWIVEVLLYPVVKKRYIAP